MPLTDDIVLPRVPDALWKFLVHACGLQTGSLKMLPAEQMPEPAHRLLVHRRDMTSTLGSFHRSALRVDVLQRREIDPLYLREVFLRTIETDDVVEYGVIAIAMDQFAPDQLAAIWEGRVPLGGLLHQFSIPFESSPIAYVSVSGDDLPEHCAPWFRRGTCYGRFNHLSKPSGEPIAWIMEILPPS